MLFPFYREGSQVTGAKWPSQGPTSGTEVELSLLPGPGPFLLDRGTPEWKLRPCGELWARATEVGVLGAPSVPCALSSVQEWSSGLGGRGWLSPCPTS